MRKKQIFISYKRVDRDVIFKLKDKIENDISAECWIDFDGIESDAQFVEVIMKAIDDADVILFMYSFAHTEISNYAMDWTVRELNYAQQNNKRIVFVNIDGTPLTKWFTMMFPLKQQVDGTSPNAVNKLIKDIKVWLSQSKEESVITVGKQKKISSKTDDDFEVAEVLYEAKEYNDALLLYLASAERGNLIAQNKLCQFFYDEVIPLETIDNIFWDKVAELAGNDEDYANFIMHSRYYDNRTQDKMNYDYVRKATRSGSIPLAFLRLGILYCWGIGVRQNPTLATHNYKKAIDMGCKEAYSYIGQQYELGTKNTSKDIGKAVEYYRMGAELLDRRSMGRLARAYHYDLEQTQNAKNVANKMIENGYYKGYVLMGDFSWIGSNGNIGDIEEAKKWYQKALLHDEYEAYGSLAKLYWSGEADYAKAYEYAQQGYLKHDSFSIRTLGCFHSLDGNNEKAWKYFKEHYDRYGGSTDALGELFFESGYRKKDESEEKQLETELESALKIGAHNGCEVSLKYLLRLFVLQETGEGSFDFTKIKAIPQSYEYIKLGSELEQPEMMYYYGKLLLEENYKEFNPVKGLSIIFKSAINKNEEALKYLLDYYNSGKYRDNLDSNKIKTTAIKNGLIEDRYLEDLIQYGERQSEISENFQEFLYKILDQEEDAIAKKNYYQALNALLNKCGEEDNVPQEAIHKYKERLEHERIRQNFGYLSRLRKHLHRFYPDYNQEQAIVDILNENDTIDSDIYYSLSTTDNQSEVDTDLQESILCQLYAPITQDENLYQRIKNHNDIMSGKDENEIPRCVDNLASSYDAICSRYGIEKKEIASLDSIGIFPYIKVSLLTLLRRQAVRCLLSIKDVDSHIQDEFLNNLDNDEQLLNICEIIRDADIQLFLISFVELNLDIEAIEQTYLSLLEAYKKRNMDVLAGHLNESVRRLTDVGIEHQLPEFSSENLPQMSLNSYNQRRDVNAIVEDFYN